MGTLLGLHLLAQFVALGEDVLGKVVNRVGGANTVHINHAFSEHRDDLLHQELAHVERGSVFEGSHVLLDLLKAALLKLLESGSFLLALVLSVLFGGGLLCLEVLLLLD